MVKYKRKTSKKRSIKRKLYTTSLIAGLSLASIAYFSNSSFFISKDKEPVQIEKKINLDYLHVKNNDAFLRQLFINKITKEYGVVEGIMEIRYQGGLGLYSPLVKGYPSMQTIFYVPEKYRGTDLETRIIIYSTAFENASSEDEFLSMLIDHEYSHTDYVRGRVKLNFSSQEKYDLLNAEIECRLIDVRGGLFELFNELYAYDRQINSFSKRQNSSGKFMKNIISIYNACVDSLHRKEETPLIKYLKDNYQKKIYF